MESMMAFKIDWLVPDRVILAQVRGDVDEEEFVRFIGKLQEYLDAGDQQRPIHFVQDVRQIGKPFTDFKKVNDFIGTARKITGWYLVLNKPQNRLFVMVSSMTAQLMGLRTRPAFTDYDTLREFLNEHDTTLQVPETLPALFSDNAT
jgi:hypothetical protein